MKLVRISNNKICAGVICSEDLNRTVERAAPVLKLKKGDSLRSFYSRHKDRLTFEQIPYYPKIYTPHERLEHILLKNSNLEKWIKELDLKLTV